MVEIFKTNVHEGEQANMLVNLIENVYGYCANFDLEDCDKILRIEWNSGHLKVQALTELLKDFGFQAEHIADE